MTNLRDCELTPYEDGPDGHRFSGRSLARDIGAERTGFGLYELEPGQSTWPYHFELGSEEWLLVVDGEVTLRTPDGERGLRAGDLVCFPEGPEGAHAVRNDSDATARFAMPSVDEPTNAAIYPDANSFVLHGPGFEHRAKLGDPIDYWET
ncbi:MAG TPA: cupin domain-containing protein [Gaiellaceae bacterium]|jgi:uncharacterized cupin superfamily protein